RTRRPAAPSTRLNRVEAATIPSRPSFISLDICDTPLAILSSVGILSILIQLSTYTAMAKVMKKMTPDRYLTAQEAAAALKVSLSTLYSYVSRGMLRSEAVAGHPRVRRYLQEDVSRLVERKELRSDPTKAAARRLRWGPPVLDSSLTRIDAGRLYCRGRDALALAPQASVEEVAALLWMGDTKEAESLFARPTEDLTQEIKDLFKRTPHPGPVERCQLALPLGASVDPGAYD